MPADPRRVKDLFAAAADLDDPADRAALLDRECGNDPDLRRRVEDLLRAHDRPASALERPLAVPPDPGTRALPPGDATVDRPPEPTDAVGDRIGPYKLLERIGEGGMGEVWVADQLEPIKRRVALKLIKPGMDSRSVLARFEAERQALAVMDHPHIARVFDAGTAADGRPYFVMELVKGTPITEFADARRLTPKQRLELFVPVCQAIQHAHLKGVIHRDIKPGNVLVELHDDRAVVKVIDFGVAKAVGQQLTEKTIYTGFGALVGTPAYMAPEQATFNAVDVDTRADVYALGVLLYELLAGSPPIEKERLRKAALDEVLRIVREEDPPRPSQRLSTADTRANIAAVRGTEPAKLSALMKGELDWIVMKALEKDRTRRYETANGFAADITRYLAGESVQAVPPSAGYRVRKFVRKHKGPVIAAVVVALAVLLGVSGTTLGMLWALGAERQAVEERNTAERERGHAVEAQADAEAARKATERKLAAAAVDLDLKYCETDERRGLLRLAQRLKTLPPGVTELRQFVTLSLFARAQRSARLLPYREPLHAISPDGRVGLRVRPGGAVELVHPLSGSRLAAVAESGPDQPDFRFSPDGQSGALVLPDEVRVYDLRTFRLRATLRPPPGPPWRVVLNAPLSRAVVWRQRWAEGPAAVPTGTDATLWDVDANRVIAPLGGGEWPVRSNLTHDPTAWCAFAPGGETLLTGGDAAVRVWSADTGRLLHTLRGHSEFVQFLAFGAGGRTAVSFSEREVIWWRPADWQQDGPVCRQTVDPHYLNIEYRLVCPDVLTVETRDHNERREFEERFTYTRGESAACPIRAVASDGRLAFASTGKVHRLRPFQDWEPTDGRQYPADFGQGLVGGRLLPLFYDRSTSSNVAGLIDLAADRKVGVGVTLFGLVPCQAAGCSFVATGAVSQSHPHGVILPAVDAAFDPDTLELWAKVLTRGGLNPSTGFFEPHDEGTWERNRQDLLRRATPVGEFPFPGAFAEDRLYWLRMRDDLRNDQKLLDRLVTEEPTPANYRTRSFYWWNFQRYDLALKDELAAADAERKAGVPVQADATPAAEQVVFRSDGPPEGYELALTWFDTRPNREAVRHLRGLALYRLGRYQEALDLLLRDEREWGGLLTVVAGPWAALHPSEQRTLLIGLCQLKLGKPAEAVARLTQARADHERRRAPEARWANDPRLDREFLIEAEDTILGKLPPPEPKK